MKKYVEMNREELAAEKTALVKQFEGYKAKASCLNGIESVRKNAPDAPIVVAE